MITLDQVFATFYGHRLRLGLYRHRRTNAYVIVICVLKHQNT
jgi:hypothetical protein